MILWQEKKTVPRPVALHILREGYSVAIKHTTRDGTVYEEASGHIMLSDA